MKIDYKTFTKFFKERFSSVEGVSEELEHTIVQIKQNSGYPKNMV